MNFELTKEQAMYIKRQLPYNYCLQRNNKIGSEAKGDFKKLGDIQSSVLEDQSKCIRILNDLSKTDLYKSLTNKENPTTYSKHFLQKFKKAEEFYTNTKNEKLMKSDLVYGKFWMDMSSIFFKCKLLGPKEAVKLLDELEYKFQVLFTPYYNACLRDTNTMLVQKLIEEPQQQQLYKSKLIKQTPTHQEKLDLLEKMNKLPVHCFKYIIDYLHLPGDGIIEINLDELDVQQFRRIQEFVKKRVDEKKLNKLYQKYKKDYLQQDYDEYSYQSFLSDSQEL